MAQYTVVFGGQHTVEASSVEEAYEEFWRWVHEQCEAKNFGLIICQTCHGRGEVCTYCTDPQCGDSTWDHDCGDGYQTCPDCKGCALA